MESNIIGNRTISRIEAVDYAKGIGILCIVLGHVLPMTMFTQWLFSFHVPIFFVLSGFTYKYRNDKKTFYKNKLLRLIVPYFCFSVISILILWVMAKVVSMDADTRIIPNLLGMCYGNSNGKAMSWNTPLWFLPCMFLSVVLMDLMEMVLRRTDGSKHQCIRLGIVIVCWMSGICLNTLFSAYLPWHLESALFLVGFSELGILLHLWGVGTKKQLPVWSICILMALGMAASVFNGWTDVRAHVFGKYPVLLVVTSVCFSLAIFGASCKIRQCPWLAYLGIHSISILVMHKFPIMFFKELIPGVQEILNQTSHFSGILCALAITVISVLLCLLAEKIIMAVFPIAFGKCPVLRQRS